MDKGLERHMRRAMQVLIILVGLACSRSAPVDADERIQVFGMRAPDGAHDVEQASGLHYGRLGEREGLWVVCDRNGGRSAGRLYYFSAATLAAGRPRQALVADDAFTLTAGENWAALARDHAAAGGDVIEEVARRIKAATDDSGGMQLDLEAVTIAPSPSPPHEPRVFVVAEEPHSVVLELKLTGGGVAGRAEVAGLYRYLEKDDEHGTDFNDGMEAIAWAGEPGVFYWGEEGTRFHDGPPGPRLFFLDPRLGRARLEPGQVVVDTATSDRLTAALQGQRVGNMQTLNAMTRLPDGGLAVVDRNGGCILRVDPDSGQVRRWLNLYDLDGTNLREVLADFPGQRRMPYISIEGIAIDPQGHLWLADDPAMPENFRASCLVRISGAVKPAE